jgi:PLP dependent protein
MMAESIKENYLRFLEGMEDCARKASRDPELIKLVVVTKGQSAEKINQVVEAGASILGENYPEETFEKMPSVGGNPQWHMIGHLQSRKTKYIVDGFSMIHSIDSEKLAIKLNEQLAASGKTLPALFEVNLSGEESKSGFAAWDESGWPELCDRLIELRELQNLRFNGLMTMPPFADDPEESRPYFRKCRRLLEAMHKKVGDAHFDQLSMGTSLDYQTAIQEGATYIRIGQAIMSERNYQNTK